MKISASRYKSSDIINRENNINILKNIDLLGHFDFQNLIITLDSVSSQDISSLINTSSFDIKKKILPLTSHEFTHFIDSTSTIWGLHHLELMQNAYSINFLEHGQEKNFYHGKIFHDHLKRIKLPNYYTELGPSNPASSEWQKINSIGLIFGINGKSSNHPVIFTNFVDKNKNLIARSPFSDLSLLECSATFQEYHCLLQILKQESSDFQEIEEHITVSNLKNTLFSKNLTEYSVCTHLVLDKFFKKDIFLALKVANQISRFCLNRPERIFNIILRSSMLDIILKEFDIDTKRRIKSALHNGNRGVLFYLIVKAMPEAGGFSEDDVTTAFSLGKRIIGIPDDWEKYAVDEAFLILKRIESGNNSLIKLIATTGISNLKKTISTEHAINFFELHTPSCYLSDLNQFHPFFHEKNKLNDIDCDHFFETFTPHETAMFKFVEACAA